MVLNGWCIQFVFNLITWTYISLGLGKLFEFNQTSLKQIIVFNLGKAPCGFTEICVHETFDVAHKCHELHPDVANFIKCVFWGLKIQKHKCET